jgi:hypothetical protein
MIASIPHWLIYLFWICVGIILLILVGLVIHALGGGLLSLHAGHFVFDLGAT